MPEDTVLQRGKRMFHRRSPQPHDFRRGALIHALQCGFVQVPCHEPPGTSHLKEIGPTARPNLVRKEARTIYRSAGSAVYSFVAAIS